MAAPAQTERFRLLLEYRQAHYLHISRHFLEKQAAYLNFLPPIALGKYGGPGPDGTTVWRERGGQGGGKVPKTMTKVLQDFKKDDPRYPLARRLFLRLFLEDAAFLATLHLPGEHWSYEHSLGQVLQVLWFWRDLHRDLKEFAIDMIKDSSGPIYKFVMELLAECRLEARNFLRQPTDHTMITPLGPRYRINPKATPLLEPEEAGLLRHISDAILRRGTSVFADQDAYELLGPDGELLEMDTAALATLTNNTAEQLQPLFDKLCFFIPACDRAYTLPRNAAPGMTFHRLRRDHSEADSFDYPDPLGPGQDVRTPWRIKVNDVVRKVMEQMLSDMIKVHPELATRGVADFRNTAAYPPEPYPPKRPPYNLEHVFEVVSAIRRAEVDRVISKGVAAIFYTGLYFLQLSEHPDCWLVGIDLILSLSVRRLRKPPPDVTLPRGYKLPSKEYIARTASDVGEVRTAWTSLVFSEMISTLR